MSAQEKAASAHAGVFDVSGVITPAVAKLEEPAFWDGVGEAQLLVFSDSLQAQEHVRKGFALIHASWDFEAYRHFVEAVKLDPQCLMAYCGMLLAMTNPEHEFKEQRAQAFNRMLTLLEYKENGEYYYPDNERIYAIGLAELLTNGMAMGARIFEQLGEDYSSDLQAQLLAAFLSRSGYNALGRPRLGQREAVKKLEELVARHPDDPLVLNFLIMAQAEAPYQAVDFKEELLPLAQRLVRLSKGEVPSWQALLGFIAWRSGEAELAIESYQKAIKLYEAWKERDGIDYADCEGLIRAQLYLATVLNDQGRQKEALDVIDQVNRYQVGETRQDSIGARTIRWYGNVFASKIYLENKEYAKAREVLPVTVKNTAGELDVYSAVLIAHQLVIDVAQLLQEQKMDQAKAKHKRLSLLLQHIKTLQSKDVGDISIVDSLGTLNALITMQKELTAHISNEGKLSYNWLQSAIDLQTSVSRLLPPLILYPMEYRMGEYLLSVGRKEDAEEFFEKALQRRPSYKKAAEQLQNRERE